MTERQFDPETASSEIYVDWLRHTAPDSPQQLLAHRIAKRVNEDDALGLRPLSIAFLRSDTLEPVAPYLIYQTARAGFKSKVWFSGYADWRLMAEDPESDLWKQQPDLVGVILNLNILAPDLVSGFVSAKF